MTQANIEFVRRFYGRFAAGELHTLGELLDDEFSFVPAGKNCPLAQPCRGLAEFFRFAERQRELTGGTWMPQPYDILASDDHAAVLVSVTASRGVIERSFRLVHVWRIRDGRGTELRSYVDDQYAYDTFFDESGDQRSV